MSNFNHLLSSIDKGDEEKLKEKDKSQSKNEVIEISSDSPVSKVRVKREHRDFQNLSEEGSKRLSSYIQRAK